MTHPIDMHEWADRAKSRNACEDTCHLCDLAPSTDGGILCDSCRRAANACDPDQKGA